MYKALFILIFTVFCFSASSQITFEVNTRSAKVDTVFDYYFGLGITDSIFNNIEVKAFASFERDQGTYYYGYKSSISNKYAKLSHITDTEKDISITSCNVYYAFNKRGITSRVGVDVSYSDKCLYGAYLGLRYKSLEISAAFDSKLYNLSYSYNPKLKVSKKISIGIIARGFYIEKKFKWRNGVTATLFVI